MIIPRIMEAITIAARWGLIIIKTFFVQMWIRIFQDLSWILKTYYLAVLRLRAAHKLMRIVSHEIYWSIWAWSVTSKKRKQAYVMKIIENNLKLHHDVSEALVLHKAILRTLIVKLTFQQLHETIRTYNLRWACNCII